MGLPPQLPSEGTVSWRMTRDPGATVVRSSIVAPGSTKLLGPSVEPRRMVTGSMRMIRSWNRWVCRTVPRLTDTLSSRRTRSNSGSHQVSHHTPRPMCAPISRAHTLNRGEPTLRRIMEGTARDSANTSVSSLRHTKELNSGRSLSRKRPIRAHFTSTGTRHATVLATVSTTPDQAKAAITPLHPIPWDM